MLLESIFKSYGSNIRQKAYNVDNPVQAKRSSGLGKRQHPFQPCSGLNSGVLLGESSISYPELRFACTGLSTFKTCGLVFET